MTNKELVRMFKEAFPDVASGYWENYPFTKYSRKYIIEKLTAIENEIGLPNYRDAASYSLSQRQKYLAIDVINQCKMSEMQLLGDAIHQLSDCVDNFRESERDINSTEHLLYYSLINVIIQTVKGFKC